MQEMNFDEVEEVSGGLAIVVWALYAACGTAAVGAGWTAARAYFCDK